MSRRPTRRDVLRAGAGTALVAAAGTTLVLATRHAAPDPAAWRRPGHSPVLGLLQATREQLPAIADAGLGAVTLGVPWAQAEPEPGRLDDRVLDDLRRTVEAAGDDGLAVSLSPGLQYPPGWLEERGAARFVDQDGREWHGETGDDVLDAVFDPLVQEAQEAFLRRLTGALDGLPLAAVRVGGLGRGELRYPFDDREGEATTLWGYSAPALERSPLPDYRPGEGTDDDAEVVLGWYLDALADHGRRQAALLRGLVAEETLLLVLMPSWGLRPGEVAGAVEAGLDGSSRGERQGTVTEGLDWDRQLAALDGVPGVAACTTWLDPPDQGSSPADTSPGRYLTGVAARYAVPVWGENTGGNDAADLDRCVDRVLGLGLGGLFWMGAADLGDDGRADLDDLGRAAARMGADDDDV